MTDEIYQSDLDYKTELMKDLAETLIEFYINQDIFENISLIFNIFKQKYKIILSERVYNKMLRIYVQ